MEGGQRPGATYRRILRSENGFVLLISGVFDGQLLAGG
jgi:hypothetical protein